MYLPHDSLPSYASSSSIECNSLRCLRVSFPVGGASLAADRNSFTEQPLRTDVAPELHHAIYVLQLYFAALQNVFYGV